MSLLRIRLATLLACTAIGWVGLLCFGSVGVAPLTLSRPLYAQQAAATPTGVITATAIVWITHLRPSSRERRPPRHRPATTEVVPA